MIKVMTTLSMKKRRSTLLLRSLAYNISASPEKLNLKHCADLLYSMCTLNFLDENLLSRVALDISSELQVQSSLKKSSVIGSIITSLGLLKYKNPVLLDLLTSWIANNSRTCRSQDIFSLFITLATLNYMPDKADECFNAINPLLTEVEAETPVVWLDHIWSKVLLNIATPEEISNVFSNNFLSSLLNNSSEMCFSKKLKLLNIHGASECIMKDYSGNKLTDFALVKVIVPRRKEKIEMSESIINSLKNLMKTEIYLKTNVDTGYGFLIDAECVLDTKCNPKALNVDNSEGIRIAILSLDYHDMTRGRIELTGINAFAKRLLEAKGYKVLTVPFNEFNTKDKLVARVQYLEKQFKELVKNV
ncbi:hypothetical protein WA026_011174 [Henosepilachna vigintioctopunctata]|uniref:RAP domain-containing protein n=1 Tax=Henosepilachna vigintioctopunctata TaxID=420089 RepID=A0AAW1U7F3_9CUCU